MTHHVTREGKKIPLEDLEIGHLKNIIALIERKAKEGINVISYGGGVDADDIWYDEEVLTGKKALNQMNHKHYVSELNKRLKQKIKTTTMNKKNKKIKIPKATKAYGFSGVWQSGCVGWMGLSHIGSKERRYPEYPNMNGERAEILKGERLFLCEITMKPVLDKKGRPITRIVK
jgi:hypothetical protein